jgi:hypothetical protein
MPGAVTSSFQLGIPGLANTTISSSNTTARMVLVESPATVGGQVLFFGPTSNTARTYWLPDQSDSMVTTSVLRNGVPGGADLSATLSSLSLGTPLAVGSGGIGVSTGAANLVFATPNGTSGAPSFRALVAGDISGAVINNQASPQQTGASFNIDGSGYIGTSLGLSTQSPVSMLANTGASDDPVAQDGVGILPNGLTWRADGHGFVANFINEANNFPGNNDGIQIALYNNNGSSRAIDVTTGNAWNTTERPEVFTVWNNGATTMAGKLTVTTGGASINGMTATSSLSVNGSPLGHTYPAEGGLYVDNIITDCGYISVDSASGYTISVTSGNTFGNFTVSRSSQGVYNIVVTADTSVLSVPKAFHVIANDPIVATVVDPSNGGGNPTTLTVRFRDITQSNAPLYDPKYFFFSLMEAQH